jgi:hypothetical protein
MWYAQLHIQDRGYAHSPTRSFLLVVVLLEASSGTTTSSTYSGNAERESCTPKVHAKVVQGVRKECYVIHGACGGQAKSFGTVVEYTNEADEKGEEGDEGGAVWGGV